MICVWEAECTTEYTKLEQHWKRDWKILASKKLYIYSTAVGRGSCSVLWNFNLLNTFICTLMVKKMNDNSYSIISCIQYYQHTVVFFTSSVTELHIKKISYFIKNPLTYFVLIFCRIYSDFSDHNTLVLLNPFQHSFKQLTS